MKSAMTPGHRPRKAQLRTAFVLTLGLFSLLFTFLNLTGPTGGGTAIRGNRIPAAQRAALKDRCTSIRTPAGPPASYDTSTRVSSGSDRYVPGTPPTLLRNGKILTGARNGTEIVFGDILLDKGVVVAVGYIPPSLLKRFDQKKVNVVDVNGKWVSPGLVDIHSHIGVGSLPGLSGSADTNSHQAPILPWLRSIDGLNSHDDSYELAISGGVTTAQIVPGSANNIGGQSFVIKFRPTADRSVSSKLVEPPQSLFINGTAEPEFVHWRHMKHACGENPNRRYGMVRMDAAWHFRQAYDEARKVKDSQDQFCEKVDAGLWEQIEGEEFPESFQWESLVDVLRGRVKLSVHCYEAVDLDLIVRLSNEFQFPVASFHHAGETYLVPDLLRKTWGGAPSMALFASNARKKREAYRGSEFAPRILAEHHLPVVMKSDHPVLNSRYLIYEAQQAHYYGLHPGLSIASVTSTPAQALGIGHRVGRLAPGYDADVVVWDSHPLALGATPTQVYIDGIPQLKNPAVLAPKPGPFQEVPRTPNWDKEARETVEYEGLPPLETQHTKGVVHFLGVKSLWVRDRTGELTSGIQSVLPDPSAEELDHGAWTVTVEDGKIVDTCYNLTRSCVSKLGSDGGKVVDLKGGSIAPGLTSFGSPLGLVEIRLEPSTNDGNVIDFLSGNVPPIISKSIVRAVDGLQFGGRNTLLAYRGGVTTAVTAPSSTGFLVGVGTAFSVGATSALDEGAIVQPFTALHLALSHSQSPSVSSQILAMRADLFADAPEASESIWADVRQSKVLLVIDVNNADIMATLIALKAEYEERIGKELPMTFTGAAEAHLLAKEIAAAGISVVLTPSRPFPRTWDHRRIMPGPPLTNETAITILLDNNVNVGIGVVDEHDARNARFDVAWAALESGGRISKEEAIALATSNLETALGVSAPDDELVAYEGGELFDMQSKVLGIISSRKQGVVLF